MSHAKTRMSIFCFFLLLAFDVSLHAQNSSSTDPIESAVLNAINPLSIEQYLYDLTKEPHHAGSKGARAVAEYVQRHLKESGFDSKLVEYHVLLPYPLEVKVTMLEPMERELSLKEQVDFHPDALLPFNAYSPSGDVTADLVYANFGFSDDFKKLKEMNVDVKGKIVIARYGKGYRGLKVRDASEAGAIGMILYSDPIDDGYVAGDMFPKGRMRPWDAVQRGSIRYSESYAGDPLTPGVPAKKNAKRIKIEEDPDMPKIPCVPMSYGEAQHLLKALEGPTVPRDWQGGLPFTYHVGPGPTKVRLQLKMDFQIRPIWNNIAEMKGSDEPEKKVILGGHRDAWIFGAQDPNSGTAVLLETARVLGEQAKKGWRPKRTIVIAQWDAEEFGLIGSTEWGEEFKEDLRKNAIAYVNFDGTVSGPSFGAAGVPLLDGFLQDITKSVTMPRKDVSVFASWWHDQNREKLKGEDISIPENATTSVGRLGGGSDHVVFLNHIGMPAMGFGFGGPNGVYHSYYDNFEWMSKHGDPGFVYHATAAKLAALTAIRLSSAMILPFSVASYPDEILRQLDSIEKRNAHLANNPAFSQLRQKSQQWKSEATRLDSLLLPKAWIPRNQQISTNNLRRLNNLLISIERLFAVERGLPGREWYKHRVVVASGYESVGLPGISRALEVGDSKNTEAEIQLFDQILDQAISATSKAISLLP